MSHLRVFALLASLMFVPKTYAALVTVTAIDLGGSSWRYAYSVTNDSVADGIGYFTLSFDRFTYANLRDSAAPADWDVLLLQPDLEIPDDGIYDALSLGAPIGLGETLDGFAVTVDFFGVDLPLAQPFTVLDAFTFEPIETGAATVTIPEPGTLGLMLSAISIMGAGTLIRRRRR